MLWCTGQELTVATAAEEMNHHLDLDLRYDHLDARPASHDVHGVTERDIWLARTISSIAAGAGLRTE